MSKQELTLVGVLLLVGAGSGAWIAFRTANLQVVTIASPPGSTTDTAVLRGQLEVMRQNADQLTELVSGALQVAIGLAFTLAAFSWYASHRVYAQDLANIRREAEAAISSAETRLQEEIRKRAADINSEQKAIATGAAAGAAKAVQEELEKLKSEFFWDQYEKHSDAARAAARNEQAPQAFDQFLRALKAVKSDRYGFTQYAELLDDLESVIRKFNYKPTAGQLETLEECYKGMRDDLRPAIDRLRRACDAAG